MKAIFLTFVFAVFVLSVFGTVSAMGVEKETYDVVHSNGHARVSIPMNAVNEHTSNVFTPVDPVVHLIQKL